MFIFVLLNVYRMLWKTESYFEIIKMYKPSWREYIDLLVHVDTELMLALSTKIKWNLINWSARKYGVILKICTSRREINK